MIFYIFNNNVIMRSILAQTVYNFTLFFLVYTEAKFASKGRFLRYINFLCKIFTKSLTCADFKYIICLVIRA